MSTNVGKPKNKKAVNLKTLSLDNINSMQKKYKEEKKLLPEKKEKWAEDVKAKSLQDSLMANTNNQLLNMPEMQDFTQNVPHQYSTGAGVIDKIGNFAKRVDNGLWGIHEGLGASLELAEDTLKQSNKANSFNNLLKSQLENQKNAASQIDYLKNYKHKGDTAALEADPEYLQAVKKLQSNSRVINAVRNVPMDTSTQAFSDYQKANSYKEKAVEGLSPTGRFIGNTAMSIGDNIAALPTAVINPNMPLAILGAKSTANKIYDVGNNGGTASEALKRGIVSGGIEAATEKIGLDNLMKFGMGGVAKSSSAELFKQFLKNTSKQSAIEGAEEGLSYIGNYGADKAFGDQNAKFDVKELGLSALGGALSGAVMGGGASLLGNGATKSRVAEQNALQAEWESQKKAERKRLQAKEYNYQIKDAMIGKLPNNKDIVIGDTPDILQKYGAKSRDMVLGQSAIRKIVYPQGYMGGKHNLGFYALEQLPYQVENPVAIFKSDTQPNSLVVFTEFLDEKNNPVMAAFHLDKDGRMGISNEVASYYGRKDFEKFVDTNRKKGNVLYEDKKRSLSSLPVNGLQLSEMAVESDPIFSIYNNSGNINGNAENIYNDRKIEPARTDAQSATGPVNAIGSISTSTDTSIDNSMPKSNNYSAEQALFNNKYGKNTVGSAEANPDSLQSLADRYGQIPEGENPKARVAVLPTQIDDSGKRVSEAARTFIEAGAITDETASAIEDSVLNGDYSHEVITDKEANIKALNTLKKTGFAEALDRWNSAYENGGATKYDLALAQRLMAEASQAGNSQVANQIGVQMATELTRSGQLLQANRMLKRLSPEGMVTFAETQINQLKGELADKGIDQKIIDKIGLTDEDITFIYDTMQAVEGMPDGREKTVALAQVKARIENKIPSSAGNKLKTLARMSMLFNPKTQVRNVLGNAIISPISNASDVIGTAIDKAVSQKTGTRTTSLPQPSALKGMKQGIGEAVEDYRLGINTRDIEGNRFEIGQGRAFNNDTKIGKVLNGIDRTTNFMLDAGDRGFYETWFNNSLEQQMKANKVDVPTEEMIKIAKNEALKRTWQDTNNYTETVSKFRNALNNLNIKGYGLGDMTLPFIKTPANLTKALVDYSPVGVVKTLKVDADNLKVAMKTGKDVAQKQRTFVDNLSKGITGTLLMVLYSALADKGILKGEGSEDKDLAGFEKNILGIQPYSAVIGDKSYSYEWAQPVGGSMAMVTDFKKAFNEADTDKGELSAYANAIKEGVSASGKVLFNQSFATGISNLFGEDDIINGLMEVALNEPSKFSPQLMGQVAQLGDGTARSTYVYGDPMATAGNKVKAKIPGERNELPPVVDVMGNEVKSNNSVFDVFFNPANYYSDVSDDAANEVYNIYKATGDKTVIPPTAPYYVMYKNNKTVLTPEQKAEYQKSTGNIISTSVNSLIKDSDYMGLSDTAKAELLNDIYGYANATAKDNFVKGYELKAAEKKIKTAEQNGIEPFEYLLFKQAFGNIDPTDTMTGSGENKAKRELLYDNDTLSADQKTLLDSMLISDSMYIQQEKNVDYSNSDSFTLTQMSEAAQKKWDRAEELGYTVEEYEKYYPVVMSGKKKAVVLGDLQMQGLSYREAVKLYGRIKGK